MSVELATPRPEHFTTPPKTMIVSGLCSREPVSTTPSKNNDRFGTLQPSPGSWRNENLYNDSADTAARPLECGKFDYVATHIVAQIPTHVCLRS